MFEKFEQADSSNTRRFGGTGLGLAICKSIVEIMNGEIGAESEPGKGSRFWVKVAAPIDEKVKAIPAIDDAAFDGVRLLAIDDNAVNRRVIEELIAGWGLRATVVDGGEAAMAALQNSVTENDRFHVILMDFQMPGEDGVALTRRIQSNPLFGAIPVIMLASIDPSQSDVDETGAKFIAHIHKPVRPSQLMDLLARVLLDRAVRDMKYVAETGGAPALSAPVHADDRIKVLLAEDNFVNQMVIRNMISAETHNVIIAENGAMAVDLFIEHAPALILMDLSMPVMDGIEATQRIRMLEAERGLVRTPIIAATAHVLDQDRERCRKAGMDDFIAKPIRMPRLQAILERWAGERAAQNKARCA